MELEAADALSEEVAGAALDWRKAYDQVDLQTLPALLMRAGVPDRISKPALAAYSARRRIRVGKAIGRPWRPSRGLLPGCPLAVFFLAVLTWPWMRATGRLDDRLRRRVYVDDFTLWARAAAGEGADAAEPVRDALRLTAAFETAMGWALNRTKSKQFANSKELRRWLAEQIPGIRAGTEIRDLGVATTAGKARRCAVTAARLRGACTRFARLGRLPLSFGSRCLLGAAAGTAAGLYGAACGRPPVGELAGLRAAAKKAVCRGGLRASAEIVFGVLAPSWRLDPMAVTVLAPLWQAAKALRRRRFPADLWREAAGAMAAGHGRRFGPIAAALRSLAELQMGADIEAWGGIPAAPDGWRPAARALPDTRAVLLEAWGRREAREVARRRADYQHLAGGVDRWATRRLLETGQLAPDAAGALRTVISGNVITESVAAKWGRPRACPHCGATVEDLEHRLWACPRWQAMRHAAFATSGFTPAAARACLPAETARTAVLPLDTRLQALAHDAQRAHQLPQLPDPAAPELPQGRVRAWTDGSCLRPADPLLARAGWGLRLEGLPGGRLEIHGPVDGRQTAQRAELWAAVHACSQARAPLDVVTDSRFVARGVAALRGGANPVDWQHADLWEAIAPHCRSGLLRARWVKAHLSRAEATDRGMSEADWAGNAAADRLADAGAQARLPPPALLQQRLRQLEALAAVQRAVAAVELAALKANHGNAGPGGPRVRRRWAAPGHRRRRAPRVGDAAAVAAAVAPPPGAPPGQPAGAASPARPRAGEAAAARALFAGAAWRPHVAAQGPAWVACLRCGCWAPSWPALASRPCGGWAPALPPRAGMLLLLPAVRAGGREAEWRATVRERLLARPGAPG